MWGYILAILVVIICSVIIIRYERLLKSIYRQLKFAQEQDTNLRVRAPFKAKSANDLIDIINDLLDSQESTRTNFKRQNEELKDIVLNLSHDIRTPLTSMEGYFQLLLDTESESERQRYGMIIKERLNGLRELLEQMFIYMKVQNEYNQIEISPLDMNELVRKNIFAFYEEFKRLQIEPVIEIPEKPYEVFLDAKAMNRVLQNIIKNALEHGKRYFSLTVTEVADTVLIECCNEYPLGEIIEVDKLFDRFYKGDTARKNTSTGLGLSIAKTLVNRMNGKIGATMGNSNGKELLRIWIEFKRA